MTEKEEKFLENVRRELDRSVAELDPDIARRLAGIRSDAVASGQGGTAKSWLRWATGLASAAVMTMLVLFGLPDQKPPAAPPDLVTLQVVSGPEPLEFFSEDLEFYQWLSEVMNNDGNPSGQYRNDHSALDVSMHFDGPGDPSGGSGSKLGTDRISGRIQG